MSARRKAVADGPTPIRVPPTVSTKMRRFELHRTADISGMSGTGVVADGIEFTNGMCAISWRSEFRTVNVHESIKSVEVLHGHEGATRVVWIDEEE